MKLRPYSATVLALGGVILMGLGVYFVVLRPPLLPEDPRYMGTSFAELQATAPGLLIWLRRVFWVMGGYMFAAGLLTVYVALTSFRARAKGAAVIVAITGSASIGWMVVVNFLIDSDFKWLLLAFALPWMMALGLYRFEKGVL
ncbi:MAG: hypothetical protein Fur0022_01930 [Anaerolineales bacterium]